MPHTAPTLGPGLQVDYAWSSLGQLKNVLIVLLVVETLFVQLVCMIMLTVQVKVRSSGAMT